MYVILALHFNLCPLRKVLCGHQFMFPIINGIMLFPSVFRWVIWMSGAARLRLEITKVPVITTPMIVAEEGIVMVSAEAEAVDPEVEAMGPEAEVMDLEVEVTDSEAEVVTVTEVRRNLLFN